VTSNLPAMMLQQNRGFSPFNYRKHPSKTFGTDVSRFRPRQKREKTLFPVAMRINRVKQATNYEVEPFPHGHRVRNYKRHSPRQLTRRFMKSKSEHDTNSISGMSAAHFITKDDSLAALLLNHGIQVRDFILLSFLSDQGPMTVVRLARVVGIEPSQVFEGVRRLSSANLLVREPSPSGDENDSAARLTGRGEDIAARISAQID